eukprot:scaffold230581_cov32-Tisochrysis_lutea.AAC.1
MMHGWRQTAIKSGVISLVDGRPSPFPLSLLLYYPVRALARPVPFAFMLLPLHFFLPRALAAELQLRKHPDCGLPHHSQGLADGSLAPWKGAS